MQTDWQVTCGSLLRWRQKSGPVNILSVALSPLNCPCRGIFISGCKMAVFWFSHSFVTY